MRVLILGTRFLALGQTQWAPTLTSHDPNPPITLESAAGAFTLTAAAGSYAIAGQAAVLEKVVLPGPQLRIIQSALRW